MNGAELVTRCLQEEGVRTAFAAPGPETTPLLAAMAFAGIRIVQAASPGSAVWMAAGYGCFARQAGCAVVPGGPALASALPVLSACTRDGYPAVALACGPRLEADHPLDPGAPPPACAVSPWTKQAASINQVAQVRDAVREAFRSAYREKPGAVALALSAEVLFAPVDPTWQPVRRFRQGRGWPEAEALAEAARLINEAQRPLVLAGHGILRSGAHLELEALAERARAPVVTTPMGKAAISFDHRLACGCLGGGVPDYAWELLQEADVVVCAGYDPGEYPPAWWNQRLHATIVYLGEVPAVASLHYSPQAEVVGDLNAALAQLAHLVEERDRRAWSGPGGSALRRKEMLLAEQDDGRAGNGFPVQPGRLVLELRRALRRQDLLTVGTGPEHAWAARHYPVYQPGTYYTSGNARVPGFALACALGLAAALGNDPDHRVACLLSGQEFLAGAADLAAAVRSGLTVMCLVACVPEGPGAGDVARMATALGARSQAVADATQVAPMLRAALHGTGPAVVAAPVTPVPAPVPVG